jgi:hypothetical protein
VPRRVRPLRFLSGDVRSGDVGGVGRDSAEGLRWRSDLREAGVLKAGAGVFLTVAGVPPFLTPFDRPFFAAGFGVPFVCGLLVCFPRFGGSGVGGAASRFTRDDLRTPFSKTVVGPLALNDFHGGDAARDVERDVDDSSTFRRFAGRMTPPSSPSSSLITPSSLIGTVSVVVSPFGAACSLAAVLGSWRGITSSRSAGVPCSIQRDAASERGRQTTRRTLKLAWVFSKFSPDILLRPLMMLPFSDLR